ncbi:MAG: alanine transaminase [Zetaproteobacteria bacterium CG12_big_fil_rev_8_21_14_0_65_55_1124]|nr:MAG: alanine transaminase [Zetaproteobacteria bacterium CG1_02_55_237]PIS18944.1 MAG: alanine transaminase [Zetaproteobacteria bacterium CG08_land_8_20_14_0_20_55_17]PIW42165.1 MAG: alanine transaminase [Zetaproteobacteria bacterium CG12_big_fil_rev_8_21_14_0_65_55_1124]PIY54353.1 MAG: alanine transaminase [Zetaproteobacteria bacterium CG_4_10_14_0_8_um_filter_55_43]PIZ38897.1 MAG: alanine transaminase [Zetaproteobacteria bacterium CG_4_10_14_0_2_um_filter_55_20]PJB82847.1 MAG: alanine tran
MREFDKIKRLPPYVFAVVNKLKMELRHAGHDIIDLGMGNPDQPTPQHIVDKLCEAAQDGRNHRYSVSKGIPGLRRAICGWYKNKFDVDLDPETEAIATIGSKEGLAHLAVAITSPGDLILTPNPAYPIHPYGFIIAGADIRHVPMGPGFDYFEEVQKAVKDSWPKPKILVVNFPSNPTAEVVDLDFYVKLVDFAKENDLIVISDIAYAEITFDDYKCPSILQVPGAKDVAVEFYSLSKTYNMPGWRMGFMVGNKEIVAALAKIKSYLDYGTFQPLQIAACAALNGPQDCVEEIRLMYQSRRDVMIDGLHKMGWMAEKPKASMFIWAEIPDQFKAMGSLEFCKQMLEKGGVAVSPGIGFGDYGDHYVRIALIENEHRTRQALRGMRQFLNSGA